MIKNKKQTRVISILDSRSFKLKLEVFKTMSVEQRNILLLTKLSRGPNPAWVGMHGHATSCNQGTFSTLREGPGNEVEVPPWGFAQIF